MKFREYLNESVDYGQLKKAYNQYRLAQDSGKDTKKLAKKVKDIADKLRKQNFNGDLVKTDGIDWEDRLSSINEAKVMTAIEAVTAIMKNKHITKNVKEFDGDVYFEMKDVSGSLRLSKRIGNSVGYGEITGCSAGEVGYFDSAIAAILGTNDAVAYIKLSVNEDLLKEVIDISGAKQVSDSEYKKNHKEIVGA